MQRRRFILRHLMLKKSLLKGLLWNMYQMLEYLSSEHERKVFEEYIVFTWADEVIIITKTPFRYG